MVARILRQVKHNPTVSADAPMERTLLPSRPAGQAVGVILGAVGGDFDPSDLPPGLREDYLRGARDRLGELAELVERVKASGNDWEALDSLRREAHKIRGSAGSYGFAEASRVAAQLEESAKVWLTDPSAPADRRVAAARDYVRRLAAALFAGQPAVPLAPRSDRAADATARPPLVSPSDCVPEVIVVEDDQALVELFEFGLQARGYRYLVFRNGREALDALRTLDVADAHPLLMMDVDLPALDGYSIFETLQRERPGVYRTVFTTVHGSDDEQLRGLEGGAMDYLVKPISLRVALEKIRRWLGR